jgi:very-short-patch-repair endonuclease
MHLPYNKNLKKFSRELRNNSTYGEVLLWKKLRAKQLGYTFNRQKPLGNYIADFYCRPLDLVIEIDGVYHSLEKIKLKDLQKEEALKAMNLEIIRFTEKQVRYEINNVVRCITEKIKEIEERKALNTNHPDSKKTKDFLP